MQQPLLAETNEDEGYIDIIVPHDQLDGDEQGCPTWCDSAIPDHGIDHTLRICPFLTANFMWFSNCRIEAVYDIHKGVTHNTSRELPHLQQAVCCLDEEFEAGKRFKKVRLLLGNTVHNRTAMRHELTSSQSHESDSSNASNVTTL